MEVIWSSLHPQNQIYSTAEIMKSTRGNQCMMRIQTDNYIQGIWKYKPSCGCVVIPKCVSYRYGWDMVLPPGWAYKSPSSLPQPSHSVRNEKSFWCYIEEFVFYVSRAQSCIRALGILKRCAKSAVEDVLVHGPDYRFEERLWKWSEHQQRIGVEKNCFKGKV